MQRLGLVLATLLAVLGALAVAGTAAAVEYPEGSFNLYFGSPAAAPGGVITVNGENGVPGMTVTLFFDTVAQPTGGGEVQIGTAVVRDDGTFTVSGTVPVVPVGVYRGRVVVPVNLAATSADISASAITYLQQSFSIPVTKGGVPVVGSDTFPTLRAAATLVVAGACTVMVASRRRRVTV